MSETKRPEIPVCNPAVCVLAIEQSWPGSWGRSTTPAGAVRRAKLESGRSSNDFAIWIAPPGAWVTGMGEIQWRTDHEDYDPEVLSDAIKVGSWTRYEE